MAFGKFGRYHPDGVDVHVSEVDLVALVAVEAGDPRVSFVAAVDRLPLETDPLHVRYIVANLVQNALKYSDGVVRVLVGEAAEGGGVLTVADRGIGVPRAELDALFSPFYRASNVLARPGTGMGLAIVKKSANLVGARVTVDSVEGGGTTFVVSFPAGPADWRA